MIERFKRLQGLANGKTLTDLLQTMPEFGPLTFFCNARDHVRTTGEVCLLWDDFHNCPGLYFDQLDSFLNIDHPDIIDDNFARFYNTEKGLGMLEKAYHFFTK